MNTQSSESRPTNDTPNPEWVVIAQRAAHALLNDGHLTRPGEPEPPTYPERVADTHADLLAQMAAARQLAHDASISAAEQRRHVTFPAQDTPDHVPPEPAPAIPPRSDGRVAHFADWYENQAMRLAQHFGRVLRRDHPVTAEHVSAFINRADAQGWRGAAAFGKEMCARGSAAVNQQVANELGRWHQAAASRWPHMTAVAGEALNAVNAFDVRHTVRQAGSHLRNALIEDLHDAANIVARRWPNQTLRVIHYVYDVHEAAVPVPQQLTGLGKALFGRGPHAHAVRKH